MRKNILVTILLTSIIVTLGIEKLKLFHYNPIFTIKDFIQVKILDKKRRAFKNPYDNPNKPNVLIIGDSISIEYTSFVRNTLKNKMDIYRIPGNARYTEYGKKKLNEWLSINKHWDVIHFNWGLWDTQYIKQGIKRSPVDEYRKNLEDLVISLKRTNAKLIWCTTTPAIIENTKRVKGDDIIYNNIALEIMKKHNINVNDLYTYALNNIENIQLKEDVHFSYIGSEYLAKKVAHEIENILKK